MHSRRLGDLTLRRHLSIPLHALRAPSFAAALLLRPRVPSSARIMSTVPSPFSGRQSQPFNLESLGADWEVKQHEGGERYSVLKPAIEVSENDSRRYRLAIHLFFGILEEVWRMLMTLLGAWYRMITLSNGLTALLIEDPKTDKAAAAMSVGVGHLSDPVRYQKEPIVAEK